MAKYTIFNRLQIVNMYPVEEQEFTRCDYQTYCISGPMFRLVYEKGEKYGIFFKHIAKEDMFEKLFDMSNKLYTRTEVNKELAKYADVNHIVEKDGVFYLKPHIRLNFSNGSKYNIFEDTYEECEKEIEKIRHLENIFFGVSI